MNQPPSLKFGVDSQADHGVRKLFSEKREGFKYALEVVVMRKLVVGYLEVEHPTLLIREAYVCVFLIGYELKVGAKMREAGRY